LEFVKKLVLVIRPEELVLDDEEEAVSWVEVKDDYIG